LCVGDRRRWIEGDFALRVKVAGNQEIKSTGVLEYDLGSASWALASATVNTVAIIPNATYNESRFKAGASAGKLAAAVLINAAWLYRNSGQAPSTTERRRLLLVGT
jgi:hypothetical protein